MRLTLAFAAFLLGGLAAHAQTINSPTTVVPTTITTGSTFQQVLAPMGSASPPRRSLTIQNNNTNSDNCWVAVTAGTPAKAIAILLTPGGSYTRYFPYVPSDEIQATCATTGDSLYVDTQ